MTNKRNYGMPAFPCEADGGCGPWAGMSMLDYHMAAIVSGTISRGQGSIIHSSMDKQNKWIKKCAGLAQLIVNELEQREENQG